MRVPQTNETMLALHRLSIAIKEEHAAFVRKGLAHAIKVGTMLLEATAIIDVIKEEAEAAVPTESADEALHDDGAAQTTPGYRSLRLAWDTATFAERKLFLDWVDAHQRTIIGGPLGFGQKFNNATTDVPPDTGDA